MRKETILALLIILASCNSRKEKSVSHLPANKEVIANADTSNSLNNPTERFGGRINNAVIIFEQVNYIHYRLSEDGKITEGARNTERGFEKDKNATVYVLNPDSEESKQKYFVRYTGG